MFTKKALANAAMRGVKVYVVASPNEGIKQTDYVSTKNMKLEEFW